VPVPKRFLSLLDHFPAAASITDRRKGEYDAQDDHCQNIDYQP
jgi:hypothetical protein